MPQPQDIYLNTSDATDIETLPGLNAERARAIVQARPIDTWSDLKRADLSQDEISALQSAGVQLGKAPGPIGEPGSGDAPRGHGGQLGRA